MRNAVTPLPDAAPVVRGGQNTPEDLARRTGTHPSGVRGVSVQCDGEKTVEELAAFVPHGQIGVTTLGKVRAAGGDVIRTAGKSPYHGTMTGLSPEQMSELLTPTRDNPARQGTD